MQAADATKISQLVAKWAAQEPQMKEANVKLRIVEPLLAALGWDASAGDIEMERSLKLGSNKVSVDFALSVEGRIAAFVETKSFDTDLTDNEAEQVMSYGKLATVRWCVLTNGKELRIYDSFERGSPADSLVSAVDLRELPSKFSEIRMLEKDALLTQEVETAVSLRKALRSAAKRFDDSRNELVATLGKALKPYLTEIPDQQLKDLSEKGITAVQLEIQRLMNPHLEVVVAPPTKSANRALRESSVPQVARSTLAGDPNAIVIICPARPTPGVTFLLRYQAWGFVRISRAAQYLGLYVSKPISAVLWFGEVEKMTPPLPSRSSVEGIDDSDLTWFEEGKRVIWLRAGTLRRLSDPIPSTSHHGHPQSARYTTLGKFRSALDTSELWGTEGL